jgi:hypothetical protein
LIRAHSCHAGTWGLPHANENIESVKTVKHVVKKDEEKDKEEKNVRCLFGVHNLAELDQIMFGLE